MKQLTQSYIQLVRTLSFTVTETQLKPNSNPAQTKREEDTDSYNWKDQDWSTHQDLDRDLRMKSRIYNRDKMKSRLLSQYSEKTKAPMRLTEIYKTFLKTHCGLFPRTK